MSEKTNPFLKPGKQFLVNFLSGLGAKPGKMSVAGINLPEFGVTENTVDKLFPNREAYNKEVIAKNEQLNKEGSLYGSNMGNVITSKIGNVAQNIVDKGKKVFGETGTVEKPELGDSFDQDKFYKNLYGLQAQQSVLRDYELGREANRQFAMMQRTLPLVDLYSETAAKRRLMEDQFSPTKISQQRLRAQTGEATLMQAIASQGSTAAQIGNIGTSRRYGR